MSDADGLICAFLQSSEGWREIGWEEIEKWSKEDGLIWIHLDRAGAKAIEYLQHESSFDPLVIEHLLAEETRPRTVEFNDSILINLRGVNLNPESDPEDMVAIRLWIDSNRILSSRRRKLLAVNDIRDQIMKGRGPKSQGDFIVTLVTKLIERMAPIIESLDEREDELEESVIEQPDIDIRARLSAIRRQAIVLRRYLSPQREAMARLQSDTISWLDARHKMDLRETSDKILRYVEELDVIRERAAVIQDEVMNKMSEQINRNMYLLAIVATIMLPLGFVTGLLGVNVDGIPGAENSPWAFVFLFLIMIALVVIEIILLKRLKIL